MAVVVAIGNGSEGAMDRARGQPTRPDAER